MPNAHLGHRQHGVQVYFEYPAISTNVVYPPVIGWIKGVSMGAVAGGNVAQQRMRITVNDGYAAVLTLCAKHQVVQIPVMGGRCDVVGWLHQVLVSGLYLLHPPDDRRGVRFV